MHTRYCGNYLRHSHDIVVKTVPGSITCTNTIAWYWSRISPGASPGASPSPMMCFRLHVVLDQFAIQQIAVTSQGIGTQGDVGQAQYANFHSNYAMLICSACLLYYSFPIVPAPALYGVYPCYLLGVTYRHRHQGFAWGETEGDRKTCTVQLFSEFTQ